ncbi:hypothetical protein HAX54_017608 [Datura stramonium]|uniref:Uncharacterized protein n=1 Tax=Datura stramonium TaxID=4076 RepID=A0ABS8S0Q9_DATST|nr:hypothetical protein [Datura stramonium]
MCLSSGGDACPKHTCLFVWCILWHLSPFVEVMCSFILFIWFGGVCCVEEVAEVTLMPLFYQHSFTPVRGCGVCCICWFCSEVIYRSVINTALPQLGALMYAVFVGCVLRLYLDSKSSLAWLLKEVVD